MGKREWEIIEQLADQDRQARLVTISANAVDAEPNAEIVHEALIRGWKRLRDWLNEDRSFRLWLQKIEEDASEWKREQDRSYLLTGRKLDEARRWLAERSHEDITTNSYEFIATSIKRRNEIEIRSIESKISFMDGELNRVGIKYFVKDQYGFLIIITLMGLY